MSRFTDFGDKGTYTGDLNGDKRHGTGKMVYDSGNTYEGGFKNDLFEGEGVYTWNGRCCTVFFTDLSIDLIKVIGLFGAIYGECGIWWGRERVVSFEKRSVEQIFAYIFMGDILLPSLPMTKAYNTDCNVNHIQACFVSLGGYFVSSETLISRLK